MRLKATDWTFYLNLKPKAAEFRLAIRQDLYFNALQVKYGYAMTCHKAQGGEWDMAVVDSGDGRGQRNEDLFRWTYTAVTRARKGLVTINAPRFDETSSMDWGFTAFEPESEASTRPDVQPAQDPDWNRLSFAQGQEKLFEYHHALRDAWREHGIAVDRLDLCSTVNVTCSERPSCLAALSTFRLTCHWKRLDVVLPDRSGQHTAH